MDEPSTPLQLPRLIDSLEKRFVHLDRLQTDFAGPELDQDQAPTVPGSPEPPD
jgi:hypothetical protein